MISELKWTKRARIAVVVLCVVLGTTGLVILSQMNQVAEAAILTPIQSPPETIFNDDFSNETYTNESWTVVSGTWAIEEGQLKAVVTDGQDVPHPIYVNTVLTDFVFEAKLKKISGHWGGLMFRGSNPLGESGDYYLVLLGDSVVGSDSYWVGKRSGGSWATLAGWLKLTGLDVTLGAKIKVVFDDSTLTVYIDDTQVYAGSNSFRSSGVFGCVASGKTANTKWYFDDVNVSAFPSAPCAYKLNVRAGVTQIVITCTWSGSGNITIANLTRSPTEVYYESDMSIYERTTASFDGTTTTIFNIKRATLSITAPSSSETWILNLSLSGVTTYQVSVETS